MPAGGKETDSNGDAQHTPSNGSKVGCEASMRSTASWKTTCCTEEEEEAELEREGITLVGADSVLSANGAAKGKVAASKVKVKAAQAKVFDVGDNSEEELGMYLCCCARYKT